MNVENNNTAETERELTDHELVTDHGNIVTIQTTLGDEDEDVHKCGRCQSEFSTLEAFIQHKLHQNCKRPHEVQTCQAKKPKHDQQEVSTSDGNPDVDLNAFLSSDDPDKSNTNVVTEARVPRGRRKRTATASEDGEGAEATPSPDSGDNSRTSLKINNDGRYVCDICDKTFKTTNILRTHMITHSGTKNFPCDLCGSAFRTKGSLIRHNRRHTDERPYRCSLCGLSFRESGALTRHLKSITPCTEKIRFNQYKEILVSKDGVQKGVEMSSSQLTDQQEVDEQQLEDKAAVVSVVECPAQQVFHEVHFVEVQGAAEEEQVLEEQSPAEVLAVGDNLICQAIINSGITLGTEVGVKGAEVESESGAEGGAEVEAEAEGEAQGEVEVDIKDEQMEEEEEAVPKDVVQVPDAEGRMTEIQVTEECVEMEAELEDTLEMSDREEEQPSSKMHKCPHCNRSFKGLNYLRFHVKGHLGYKPFKCVKCQKEFLTGYLLKKHMEVHLSERRYKCGECGKLYKTIGHVREHMRAHSDERPFHCNRCDKGYKTKNALQVHQRTHAQEKPYVCQYCLRGFREKGSLVRHIRHHTGEKPFKCHKCGRGFAEHGTLNRHLRAKGGCFVAQKDGCEDQADLTEDQASADSVATAAIISDDPHAVLVEFSSVVADTQEYIIGTSTAERLPGEELTVIQDGQNQMGNHIMKVVQQIVNQSRGGRGGHHIILRNVTVNEGPSISDSGDTITIATPESLTEQVSMTLASAISDGTLLAAGGALETPEGTFTMVTAAEEQEVEVMEQQEEFVITSPEVEIQTVIV